MWQEANLTDVNFVECNLESSAFINAKLLGANLSDSRLIYTDFSGADLPDAKLINCDLYMAKLDNIIEENTDWDGADRRKAQELDQPKIEAEQWPTARSKEILDA